MINWLNKYDIGGNPGDPLKQFYDRMVKQYPDLKYGQVSNIPFKTSKDNNTASYHENEVNNCIYGLECIPVNERAAFNAEYKKLFPKGSHKLETGKRFKSQEEIDNYIQQEKKVYQNIYLDSNGLIAMPFKTKQPYFQEHLEEVIGKPEQETGVIEQPSNFANIPDSTLSWDQLQEKYKHLGPTDPVYRMPNDDTKGNRIIIGFNYRKPNKDNPRISSPAQIIFDEYKKLGGSTRLLNRYDNGGPGKPKTVKIDFGNGSPYGSGIQEIAIDSPEYKYIYPSLMSKGLDPTSGETLYYGTPMEHIKFTPADSEFYENAENSANTYNPLYFQEGITPTLGPVEYALGAYALAPLVSAAAPALSTALTTDATIGGVTVPGLNLGNALWANGLNTAYNQITDSNSSTNTAINDYNSNPSLGTAANLALQGAIMGWNSSPITSASNQMLFNGINRTGQLGANAFNKVNNFVKGSPGGFNYFKDLGYSLRQGKLPTYRNVTRWQPDRIPTGLLRSGELLTPEQKALTGSWYTYKPEKQLGFYMQTRPGAGNVDVLRLSDRQIMELEKSMPGSAKGMSGKDISTPTSEHHLSGELVIPREIRNRAKSFRFDVNPSEYVFNGHPAYLGVDPGSPFGRSMVGEHALNVVNSNYNNIFGIPRKYFPFKEGGSAKWLDQYDVGGGPCPDGYVKNAVGICVPAPKNISQQFNIQNQLDLRKAAEEKTTDNKPQKPVKPQGLDFATDIDISAPASSTYVAPKVVPNQSQINYDAKVSTRADEIQQKTGTDRKTATDLAKKEINPGTITAVPDKEAAEIKAEGPSYAAQVKADKKAEPLIENNPQGDRTNQEWLASFSPFDQETLMTSNYRSMFQPELWKQSLQGLESLGRFTVNHSPAGLLYKDVANIAGLDNTDLIKSPLYVAPGYTQETARNASPLQTLSVLSYPQRAVQGMMTGSSLLNPEPFLTYNNYGSSNINTQNIAASIASDPLMLPGVGAIPFDLVGAGLRGLGAGYRGLTNLGKGLKNTRLSKLEPLPTLPRFEMPTIPRFELPATTPRFSNHDDFLDALGDFYMYENIPTQYATESVIQNYERNLGNYLDTNFPEFNINPINLRTSLSTLDPADAQRVYEGIYNQATDLTGNGFFSTDDLNAMRSSVPSAAPTGPAPNVSTSGASRYVPQEYNVSRGTRQEVLQRANEQGKAKIANMTDDEFKNSVLKINGDVEFVDDIGNSLDDVTDISEQSYINYFYDNISDLNKKIKAKNKSGIDYHVKGLESAYPGHDTGLYNLVIEVPEQTKIIDGVETFIPATTNKWMVTLQPGLFAGDVKNINNQKYFQSIPGLEMNNTTSGIFPGNLKGRRGSGMYEALNEFLKENALGRVKPGFNSQTQTRIGSDGKIVTGSKDVWENFINKGKAYGYYGDLGTVYGIMKRRGGQKKLGGSTGWLDKYPWGGPAFDPKTINEGVQKARYQNALDWHEDWMNSPKYKEMLYKDGANSKDSSLVDRTRKNNLSQIRKQPLNISYEDYPNMRAMYSPDNKNVTLYTEGWKKPTVLTHEVGHAVDLNHLDPSALSENKDKLTMPQEDINFITNRRFPKTKDGFFISPEGIKIDEIDPSFRTAPLLYPTPEKYVDFGDQQFRWAMGHPYFTRPTEVRSRLSEIRKYSQDNGVYDPFTQGAPKSVLDINHPAMQELKSYYSDDDIMEMLNRISYNNNNSDQTGVYQSKFGGVIKYQDGGSKEMPLGLPLKEQNPYLVPEHYKPTANGYILPDSARAQLLNTGASEYKYTYGFDDGEVQVPSIVGGQYIGDQAIDRYMLTGEQFKPMTDPRSYSNFYDDMSRLGLMQPDYNPKYKKGGVKSSAEGYYDYINGYKGVSLSKGGSSKKGWLEKYK